uniref:Uncharacterized protein n=1 Tax=Solanum tuberosum TaxID=4113 RepID=M1A186_SOLTU
MLSTRKLGTRQVVNRDLDNCYQTHLNDSNKYHINIDATKETTNEHGPSMMNQSYSRLLLATRITHF